MDNRSDKGHFREIKYLESSASACPGGEAACYEDEWGYHRPI